MWLAPVKLSAAGDSAEAPQVSTDAQGDALSVWRRYNGTAYVIEAASRPVGTGSWQPPVALSNTKEEGLVPQVGLDSKGDAVAVWESNNGTDYSIQAATRSGLTGSWQAPVTLKMLGAAVAPPPDLAVDPQGDAVAIWPLEEKFIEAATRPAGGSWQTPETLSKTAAAQHSAQVGIDAAGDATAVWEEDVGGETLTDAASRPARGKWHTPEALSTAGENANEPRVAVDAHGDAVAVWERPAGGKEVIEAATKPAPSVTWGKPVALTNPAIVIEPANQQVAIDAQGEAVVTWSWLIGGIHDVVEATEGRTSSSVWQTPVALSAPGANVEEAPQVAVNGAGNATVVWERSNGTNEIIEAASGLAASGSWQTPVSLSAAGKEAGEPQVALDAQGNAVAVWKRFDGADYIAEAAGFDAAGPLLNSLAIPATGTVGQSLAFSVSPFDVWSALGATSWSFGDGTSQMGTSVTHAYGAPGTYSVNVTSLDALGNATSTSGAISITAPAAAPKVLAPVAPRITGARLSHSRFRVSKRATAISAKTKVPQGTSFHFTLSEGAKLQIAFERSAAGLRSGKRCVAPSTKLRRRHAKHCTRTLTIGTLTRAREQQGVNSLGFSGRIGKRALAHGAYRAVLTASANGLRSVPVALTLTVVR